MFNFKYIIKCVRNGQTLYVSCDEPVAFSTSKESAQRFGDRADAEGLCKMLKGDKRLCIKKATLEKVGLTKEARHAYF